MKDMFKNFFKFIGLKGVEKACINSFYVGNIYFVIFDYSFDKGVIFDKILQQILNNKLNFYWFRSYYEFENYFEMSNNIDNGYIFIIIG